LAKFLEKFAKSEEFKHPDWGAIGSSSSDNDNSDDDSDNITATRIKPTIQG
jgi:hypothetical protein